MARDGRNSSDWSSDFRRIDGPPTSRAEWSRIHDSCEISRSTLLTSESTYLEYLDGWSDKYTSYGQVHGRSGRKRVSGESSVHPGSTINSVNARKKLMEGKQGEDLVTVSRARDNWYKDQNSRFAPLIIHESRPWLANVSGLQSPCETRAHTAARLHARGWHVGMCANESQ